MKREEGKQQREGGEEMETEMRDEETKREEEIDGRLGCCYKHKTRL